MSIQRVGAKQTGIKSKEMAKTTRNERKRARKYHTKRLKKANMIKIDLLLIVKKFRWLLVKFSIWYVLAHFIWYGSTYRPQSRSFVTLHRSERKKKFAENQKLKYLWHKFPANVYYVVNCICECGKDRAFNLQFGRLENYFKQSNPPFKKKSSFFRLLFRLCSVATRSSDWSWLKRVLICCFFLFALVGCKSLRQSCRLFLASLN